MIEGLHVSIPTLGIRRRAVKVQEDEGGGEEMDYHMEREGLENGGGGRGWGRRRGGGR